jgi:endonuclease I
MKKLILLILILPLSVFGNCEIDSFYNSIPKVSGISLSSSLTALLTKTHKVMGYDELHRAYRVTDIDNEYDADGSILDMYSERPDRPDAYAYKPGRKLCGTIGKESSCYNREHLFPQGLFRKKRPMKTDIFHVIPTDGKVNQRRGSFPFGEVTDTEWTSTNGSKVGLMKSSSYTGKVFEPIDEFKGDIARSMLYFTVRYKKLLSKFKSHPMLEAKLKNEYKPWFLKLMIKWHKQDPVSLHESRRNSLACNYQHNRNPFIDHPEWVSAIWESN